MVEGYRDPPLRKRDGVFTYFTSPEEEAALWRSVMNFLHDATEDDEDEDEEEEDEEEEPPEDDPCAAGEEEGPELIP